MDFESKSVNDFGRIMDALLVKQFQRAGAFGWRECKTILGVSIEFGDESFALAHVGFGDVGCGRLGCNALAVNLFAAGLAVDGLQ